MAIDLSGKRILVVEDMYLIAEDISRALEDAGVRIVGPVGTLAQALELASDNALDAAVLDINLDGWPCFAVADTLHDHGVPYLFFTGYDGSAIPQDYLTRPRLAKPCTMHAMLGALAQLCDRDQS